MEPERIFAVGDTAYTTPDAGNASVYGVKVIAVVPDPDGELETSYAIKVYTPVDDYIDIRNWRRLWKTELDAKEHFQVKRYKEEALRKRGERLRAKLADDKQ